MPTPIDVAARFPLASVWWRVPYPSLNQIDAIAVHHTVTQTLSPAAMEGLELAELQRIYDSHLNVRGLGGIGYHGVAFPSGRSYITAPLDRWGAHVKDQNNHLWGFAAAGTYTNIAPPEGVRRGLADLIALADRTRGRQLPLYPHRHWEVTTCPGNPWVDWVPSLRTYIEDNTTPDEPLSKENDMPKLITVVGPAGGTQIVTDGFFAIGLPDEELKQEYIALGLLDPTVRTVSTRFLVGLHSPGSYAGGGTAATVIDELARRLRG